MRPRRVRGEDAAPRGRVAAELRPERPVRVHALRIQRTRARHQGLTLAHFSAQCKHTLLDTLAA